MRTEDRVDRMLDQALEMTFPASDPFTVYMPEVEVGGESKTLGLDETLLFPAAA